MTSVRPSTVWSSGPEAVHREEWRPNQNTNAVVAKRLEWWTVGPLRARRLSLAGWCNRPLLGLWARLLRARVRATGSEGSRFPVEFDLLSVGSVGDLFREFSTVGK